MNTIHLKKILSENKNFILLLAIIVVSGWLIIYILFVNSTTSKFFGNTKPVSQPEIKNYTTVDKALNEVINSKNPKETAENNNLTITDDLLKVLITLKDQSFVFTNAYGKEELRYGQYIQAAIKFDKLEELAQNPQIGSIAAPLKSPDNWPSPPAKR